MNANQPTVTTTRKPLGLRSRALRLSAAAAAATLALVDLTGAAHATVSDSRHLVDLANWDRHIHNVPVIGISGNALWKAQLWANHVAWTGTIEHSAGGKNMSPAGYSGTAACFLGENVGVSDSLEHLEAAWMASPLHRANLLYPHWNAMGIGVVWQGNRVFAVQEYVEYRDASGVCPGR